MMKSDVDTNPWEKLKSHKTKNFNTKKFHKSFYWGIDPDGTLLMIWELSKVYDDAYFKRITGNFSSLLKIVLLNRNNVTNILIKLTDGNQWSIFKSFCLDLIKAVDEYGIEDQRIDFFVDRLINWKSFWKKSNSELLNNEEIKGLLGELKFLNEFLLEKVSGHDALRSWVGPNPNPQDFSYNNNTYEVKVHDESVQQIKISSKEQLTKNTNELFLVVYSVAASNEPTSLNLVDYVKEIKAKINANECDLLEQKLNNVGYSYNKEYRKYGFTISAAKFHHVADDFPRITTSIVHASIKDLTYKIPLSVIQKYRVEEDTIKL